jgi:hypothetical protein
MSDKLRIDFIYLAYRDFGSQEYLAVSDIWRVNHVV